jgi:Na+-translocating ferredoxin:NAD+ oxidoreductase RnfD subunit
MNTKKSLVTPRGDPLGEMHLFRPKGNPASMTDRVRRLVRTPKGTLLLIFALLLGVAATATGWPVVLPHVLAAVAGACLAEVAFVAVLSRRLAWPSSALLSGLIVAFILGPDTAHVVTLFVGVLATASKHLLTTSRGHVFNPAALALLVSIPVFATGQSWWGAGGDLAWPFLALVIAGGALIVDRINKFPLVLAFAGTYFGLFTLISLADPAAVAEMFRAPFVQAALFLALFMLTDPPTSPGRYPDQVWVGMLAALTACVGQLVGAGQAYLLLGVLVGNAALAVRRTWRAAPARRPSPA